MRPVLAIAALGVLLIGSLAACSDDDPLHLSEGDNASFSLTPQLNRFGPSEMLPINLIQLTVESLPDSSVVMTEEFTVAPGDPSWDLHLDVPLIGGNPIDVIVKIELINVDPETGVRSVEWSGIAGPFSLEPGETTEPPVVDLFRGSLENLSITAVSIDVEIDGDILEGDSLVMRATAQGATAAPQFFWSSLAPTVADVDSASADSVIIRALLPGVARIVVEAGQHADTFEIGVGARVTDVALTPSLDTLDALDAQALFTATALDARGDPVSGPIFDWVSSDTMVARSLGNGAFRAVAAGNAIITASTPSAPGIQRTAALTVRQVVAGVAIAQNDTSISSGTTLPLAATARDANAFAVAGATFAWSSDNNSIASVNAAGVVSAAGVGTTRVRAVSGGVQDSVTITVVAGAVASVVASEDSLVFGALNEFVTLTATVTDAQGNPTGTPVTWTSDSEGVATVNASGRVDAAGNGDAWIIASAGGVADSVHVDVQQIVTAVDVTVAAGTIASGTSTTARGRALDAGGDSIPGAAFAWSSSAPTVASVDAAGTVTGHLVGGASIVGTHAGFTASAPIAVVAGDVASVDVQPEFAELVAVGQTATFTATSRDAAGNDCGCTATWSSRDESVATVDGNGVVTAVATGTTWVIADVAGIQDSAEVVVSTGGATFTWIGGAAGAERDWSTPANWSPARVPVTGDTAIIPATAHDPTIDAASVGLSALIVETGALLEISTGMLVVNGPITARGDIITSAGGSVFKDGPGGIEGTMPAVVLFGETHLTGPLSAASLQVTGVPLTPLGHAVTVEGDLIVNDGGALQLSGGDVVSANGRTMFLDAATEGFLEGGLIIARGDFHADGCGSFVSTGTEVYVSGSNSHVSVACPGIDGNRFRTLSLGGDPVIFDTDVYADSVDARSGDSEVSLQGAGTTLTARSLVLQSIDVNGLFLELAATDPLDGFAILGVGFSGFTGAIDAQLTIVHPGRDEPFLIAADFDPSASGDYLLVDDADAASPYLEVHVATPNGDGSPRTTAVAGASAWWQGQTYAVLASSGDDQTGPAFSALADSLVVQALDVFEFPVAGATVDWTVVTGGGSVAPSSSVTDAGGYAATEWTLGDAFEPQQVLARVAGADVDGEFTATSAPSAPGATVVWLGTVDDQWGQGANWSEGNVPGAADTVYIPAGSPNTPRVHGASQVSGAIIEVGASINTETDFTIGDYLLADGPITGAGVVRLVNTEVRHSESEGVVQLPSVQIIGGQTFLWNRVEASFMHVLPNSYLELTYGGLETTGNVVVDGDDSFLAVWDSLIVGGNLIVGGIETIGEAYLQNHSDIVVAGDLLVAGRGMVEFADQDYTIRVLGDARWESVMPGEGIMPAGTMYVGGDWHMEGPSFHSPELLVVFDGADGEPQTITHLDVGHGPGQGHFGSIHVTNPDGLTFLTPSLIRSELTTAPGVPVNIGDLVIEGDADVGSISGTSLTLDDLTVGDVTLQQLTLNRLDVVTGTFEVDSTTYVNPDIEGGLVFINPNPTYDRLAVVADSAIVFGEASANRFYVGGRVRLAGPMTVAELVQVDGATADLALNGYRLELLNTGILTTGAVTGTGVLTMTQPGDTLIAYSLDLQGGSTVGRLTDGIVYTDHVTAEGVGFHASGNHRVVLDGTGLGSITIDDGSLADGVGARFATLEIPSTSDGFVQMNSDAFVQSLVIDDELGDAQLSANPGSARSLVAESVSIDGAYLSNVALFVDGTDGTLEIDNVTFADFDATLTQLSITHWASITPFLFSGMTFDPIASEDGSRYVSAVRRASAVDANLVIDIDDTNVDNGEAFTVDDDATADVRWINDPLPVPPPATIAWTGDTSADWYEGSNWNTGVAPTSSDIAYIFSDRPNDPSFTDATVAGLIMESGAILTVQDTLYVTGDVLAGNTVNGPGVIVMLGTGELRGTVPGVIVGAGSDVTIDSTTTVNGSLRVMDGGSLRATEPLDVSGDLIVNAGVFLMDGANDVDVAGSVHVLGALPLSNGTLHMNASTGTLHVGGDLLVDDVGTIYMMSGDPRISVTNNVRFEGDVSSDGNLLVGRITLSGDFYAENGSFRSTGTTVTFSNAFFPQSAELVNSGTASTQSQFGPVTVNNPNGLNLTPSPFVHVQGDLTNSGGGALSADRLTVAGTLSSSGPIAANEIRLKQLDPMSSYTAGFTGFFSEPGDGTISITSAVSYQDLHVLADSALTDGAVTVAGGLQIGGGENETNAILYLGGPITVGASLLIAGDNATGAAFHPGGFAVDVAGDLLVGNGVLSMTNALDLVTVQGRASFFGPFSGASHLTQGLLRVAGDVEGIGAAFEVAGTHVEMNGAGRQEIDIAFSGGGAGEARFDDLTVSKTGGDVVLLSDVYVAGSLTGNESVITDGVDSRTLRVLGHVDVSGTIDVDSLQYGGNLFNVGTTLAATTTEFFGGGQAIPNICCYQNVLVSGSGATSNASFIAQNLDITGELTLVGPLNVEGVTTVTGRFDLDGQQTTLDSLNVFAGDGIVMDQPSDQLNLVRRGNFVGGSSTLSAGTLFAEANSEFITADDAFVSTGTLLRMRGALLDMNNAGPNPGQGRLTELVLETPTLVLDSAYVTGNVTELAAGFVGDIGDGTSRAKLHVLGDIVTPNVGYFVKHISVAGDLQIDANNMDVDTVEFTGTGQLVRVVDPVDASSVPYSTILVTGPSVTLGNQFVLPSGEFTDLTADVIVRGPGVRLDLTSNDGGTIGSLLMEDGDATQRVYLYGNGWEVQDSIVVASGVLDLNANTMQVNSSNAATIALHTLGTGAIEMNGPGETVNLLNGGNALFEGGSTDGLLTDGVFHTQAGSVFRSVGDAFRSTGTTLVMRGDTIDMIDSGPEPGQGQLVNLDVSKVGFIEVLDSLYVTGNLTDVRIGGTGLHDQGDDALIRVLGNVDLNAGQYVIDHFAIGGSFIVDNGANWAVDTTEFSGVDQAVPSSYASGGAIPYNILLFTGSGTDFSHDGVNPSFFSGLPNSEFIVRGPGTSLRIHNNDGDAEIGSLRIEEGDVAQSVTLMAGLQAYDSVHVATGVLNTNNHSLMVNLDGVVANGLTVTGSGAMRMDQPFASLDVVHGPSEFTSSVASVLSAGTIEFNGFFYSENDAFRSTGTNVVFRGERLEMVNGGPAAGQGSFYSVHLPFDAPDPTFAGTIHLQGTLTDDRDGTLTINSDPGTILELSALDLTSSSDVHLSKLIVHDSISSFFGGLYDIDVTEYAGTNLAISRTIVFDTLAVTGSALWAQAPGVGPYDLANVVLVDNGVLTMTGGNTRQRVIRDHLIVDGSSSAFDLNGANLVVGNNVLTDSLSTRNGGVLVSQIFGYLSLNGDAYFAGGSTEDRLTEGLFYFNGNFYAEGGAFQASGNHTSQFEGGLASSSIEFRDPGAADGFDHFNVLSINHGGTLTIESDVFVIGDLDDGTDPSTTVRGSGEIIHADGVDFGGALTIHDVTIEIDSNVDPTRTGAFNFNSVTFGDYAVADVTRLRIRHPGEDAFALGVGPLDLTASTGGTANYLEAFDTDHGDSVPLQVSVTFTGPQPSDWPARSVTDGEALIFP